jgi:hypothetical protein
MGGLGLLAMLAASFFRNESVIATVDPGPRPEWASIDRPHPAFELQMPEWAASNVDYAILRRAVDGGRKDVLSWGEPAASGPQTASGPQGAGGPQTAGGPYVMVEIYRPGSAGERFIDAPSEIAARIVSFTVTDDVKAAGQLDTKFGAVPLVDFAIATHDPAAHDPATHDHAAYDHATYDPGDDHAKPRRCLGFARPFSTPVMQISGWYCSPGEEVVDRAMLSCALDRLTMLSSGNDPDLAALFARAEVKRTFCGQRSPILAATPERAVPVAPPRNTKSGAVKLRGRLSMR